MQHSPGVFVLKDDNTLVNLRVADFATEDDFQQLLAKFPELLVGDQIDSVSPRRFILVQREAGIGSEAGSTARWSIDHLFLDQDGVPTLVEVKRSADTRLRREVVGQMLDYAANGIRYWPAEELRRLFEQTCAVGDADPAEVLHRFTNGDPDAFWAAVNSNLLAGRIRMLFVADRIPSELRTIVEFLNKQMSPAEVLAVELRQYEGQGLRTIVPVMIGQTQAALQAKGMGSRPAATRAWDEQSFLAALAERCDEASQVNARIMIDWIKRRADRVVFNTSVQWGAISPLFEHPDAECRLFALWVDGSFNVHFEYMKGKPVFGELHERQELLRRMNEIPGISLPLSAASGRKTLRLSALTPQAIEDLLRVMDWFVERWRNGGSWPVNPEKLEPEALSCNG